MFSKTLLVAFTTIAFAISAQAAPRPAKGAPQPKSQPISSAAPPPASSSCPPAATVTVTASGAAATSTSSADKATSTGTAGGSTGGANNGTATDNGDPQKSLTLDPKVIATGFASDGQQVPTAGQVPSLTSTNNFINFCLTVPDKAITNGQQIVDGSCNPAPMGVIAAKTNMPSSKFVFPTNFDTIKSNTAFTIQMAINHLQTGNFVNAQANYYAAPQQVNNAGDIIGHTHVAIDSLTDFRQTTPNSPAIFSFFKGVNGEAQGGIVTADVTAGLPAGFYRLASINAAANHQPVLVAVAQHATLDDMVYFSVTDDGNPPPNSNSTGTGSTGTGSTGTGSGAASTSVAATGGAAQTTSAAAGTTSVAAGTATASAPAKTTTASSNNGNQGGNNGQNNGNKGGNNGQNNGNNGNKGGNQNQHCFFGNRFCVPF